MGELVSLPKILQIPIPVKRTIHAVLDRQGLVERRGRVAAGTPLSLVKLGQRPNELWSNRLQERVLA